MPLGGSTQTFQTLNAIDLRARAFTEETQQKPTARGTPCSADDLQNEDQRINGSGRSSADEPMDNEKRLALWAVPYSAASCVVCASGAEAP